MRAALEPCHADITMPLDHVSIEDADLTDKQAAEG
jgi:hypothetical protein